jgi:hypothetical protein
MGMWQIEEHIPEKVSTGHLWKRTTVSLFTVPFFQQETDCSLKIIMKHS